MLLPLDRTHRFTLLCSPQHETLAVDVDAIDSEVDEDGRVAGDRARDFVILEWVQYWQKYRNRRENIANSELEKSGWARWGKEKRKFEEVKRFLKFELVNKQGTYSKSRSDNRIGRPPRNIFVIIIKQEETKNRNLQTADTYICIVKPTTNNRLWSKWWKWLVKISHEKLWMRSNANRCQCMG